jgi:hypothetical protein
VVSLTVFFYKAPQPYPSVPLPKSNGYDDFVAAQKLIVSSGNDPWRSDKDLTLARAQPYIGSNAPALARVRTGLAKEWKMPLGYGSNWFFQHINSDLPDAKKVGQRFSIEGYVAEQTGRFGDAADSYASGIHFGAAYAHGGLVIDWLVAVAIENLQFGPLEGVVDKLDVNECKHTIAELQAAATNYESFSTIVDRDKQWGRYYDREFYGSFRTLVNRVSGMIRTLSLDPEAPALARAKNKFEPSLLRLQQLQVSLARRAFELEHHAQPKSWSDLVPAYLPAIPTNSATGKPLAHQFSE